MKIEQGKKIYFVSDVHLGLPDFESSLEREKLLVKWLNEIREDAQEIYLLGDIFDFWHEWKRIVPRGFTRFLGKIAEISDSGTPVHFFTGNHDIWVYDYLPQETGVMLHRLPEKITYNDKKFYIAHGDGLSPKDKDKGFRVMKSVFTSRWAQWFLARLHPNFSMWFGHTWSQSRREHYDYTKDRGAENEWLVMYSREILQTQNFDYFVYGHRHIPRNYPLSETCRFINIGDWVKHFTFGIFDGEEFELKHYKQ